MPLYEYECRSCEARFEQIVAMASADTVSCPRCSSSEARRLLSVIAGLGGKPEAPPAQGCGGGACGNC